MRQLRLVGLNDDGSRLVLRDEGAKTEYLLPVDERLSAALRGDRARLGQLEITLESQLRPREMQSRVRAGESPEQVAKAAGLPLDRVLRFVAPVIAEREHIVERARRAAVRRPGADGPGPVLEPTVVERLHGRGATEESLEWDAWRRDDGKWTVQIGYELEGQNRVAQWSYDAGAHSAVALDDEARALTGLRAAAPPELATDDTPHSWDGQPPRLTTVPDAADTDDAAAAHGTTRVEDEYADSQEELELESAELQAGGRNRGRAHVPSWDEIMFGRRRTRE